MKNKETIEEAAFRLYPDEEQWTDRHIFKTAANWQASQQTKGAYDKVLTIGICLVIICLVSGILLFIKSIN
tara:strand:- start:382 stop:594 length:213 start_codon:yes stop_codon:yes gene_type:complete